MLLWRQCFVGAWAVREWFRTSHIVPHARKKMKLRILLPVIYLALVVLLFLGHAQGAGHGRSLEIIPYVSFPTMIVIEWLFGEPQSFAPFGLSVLATLGQWFLVGYIL